MTGRGLLQGPWLMLEGDLSRDGQSLVAYGPMGEFPPAGVDGSCGRGRARSPAPRSGAQPSPESTNPTSSSGSGIQTPEPASRSLDVA